MRGVRRQSVRSRSSVRLSQRQVLTVIAIASGRSLAGRSDNDPNVVSIGDAASYEAGCTANIVSTSNDIVPWYKWAIQTEVCIVGAVSIHFMAV
jgi:hypothetical protein